MKQALDAVSSSIFSGVLMNIFNATPSNPEPLPPRSSVPPQVENLEFQVERLLMITEALWGILKEKHGYSDGELINRVAMIDLKDGKLDGKVAKSGPAACPRCQRALNRNRCICIYCGEKVVQDPFGR
jgi:hypothetical protein